MPVPKKLIENGATSQATQLNIFPRSRVLSNSSEIFRLSPGLTNRQSSGAAA
ncbi:hypothetical protein QUB28_11910 [Microcoleus sp. B4-C3]|uniref:hypothetical protein n=1 Tax=unclassified Microcoleus TaxID=2642155 RepID=UPI002FD2CE10